MQRGLEVSQKTMQSQLIEFRLEEGLFYCLEEFSSHASNGRAIVFLHGLGENRSGLNYLFHELSEQLTSDGFAVYRFDLAGCGESSLPLSFQLWRKQLTAVEKYLEKFQAIHLVARGVSSYLLPKDQMGHIAIGPIVSHFFCEYYPQIPIEQHDKWWIPQINESSSPERDCFWFGLGIEAGCLGGFYLTRKFLIELQQAIFPIPNEWTIIYSGNNWPYSLPSWAHLLSECHPLFVYQDDRVILYNQLTRLLNAAT